MTTVVPALAMSVSMPMTASPLAVSRLPVGSSARISFGSATRARATATRCCWPPESCCGRWRARCGRPTRSQRRRDPPLALGRTDAAIDQRDFDILLDGELVDQVEALEHEADVGAAQQGQSAFGGTGDILVEKEELTIARTVEQAKNVQQGRLAATRRPHDGDELALA